MAEEEKPENKGFTVQDRRRFSPETGEAREEAAEAPEQASPQAAPAQERGAAAQANALPEIDFSTFVISLSTQVLMHLGEIANPVSGKIEADISVAKQMIDILAMLKTKTNGNLNANEAQMMEGILFDLRMKYVEAVKKR
jgi:PBP1b-binding outer membrane lipoprotein LpoB